jgi:hypothetical protein
VRTPAPQLAAAKPSFAEAGRALNAGRDQPVHGLGAGQSATNAALRETLNGGRQVQQLARLSAVVNGHAAPIQRAGPSAQTSPEQQPLKSRATYRDPTGEAHALYLDFSGETPVLIRASEPAPLEAYLANLVMPDDATQQQLLAYQDALQIQQEVVTFTDPKKGKGKAWRPQDGQIVHDLLQQLAARLAVLPGVGGGAEGSAVRPPSRAVWNTQVTNYSDGRGGVAASSDSAGVDAFVTTDPGPLVGSEPTYISPLLQAVNALAGGRAGYIAGHMLNHHLHGKGTDAENLAPISASANTSMERLFEKSAKEAVLRDNKALHIVVTPVWPGAGDNAVGPESSLPTSLTVAIQEHDFQGVDTPQRRAVEANWVPGAWIHQAPFLTPLRDDYVDVDQDLVNRARGALAPVDKYRNDPVGFPALPPQEQADLNARAVALNAIIDDPVRMHNYLTHFDALLAHVGLWRELDVRVLGLWEGSRKRK